MIKLYEITKNYFNDDGFGGASDKILKSLFLVRRCGFDDEQARLNRYYKYFAKLDSKQYELVQELHALCSANPSIDVNVKELVDRLYEILVGNDD